MCRKIKAATIVLIFVILCCCQNVYTRAWSGWMALAAEDEEEPAYTEIKGYLLRYEEPDGENGYYKSMPRIVLTHQDEGMITKYRFTGPSGEETEGQLDKDNLEMCREGPAGDGTYKLEVWLETVADTEAPSIGVPNLEGALISAEASETETSEGETPEGPEIKPPKFSEEELKKWEQTFTWKVDGTPPEIQIIAPSDNQWYRETVTVKADAKDTGSGLAGVNGGYGEESFRSEGSRIQFEIKSASTGGAPVRAWLTAEDQAGNQSEKELFVHIDRAAPVLSMTGADNYMISGRDLNLSFKVQEENICQSMEVSVVRENQEGEASEALLTDWQADGSTYTAEVKLDQDGIYRFRFTASDAAGNRAELYRQVILDKTNPVIRFIELFQGRWLKEFCWNYDVAEAVEDFTTCTYHLELDGRLYTPGQRVLREGRHMLKLTAKDAAGNEAFSSAEFMIDNTPPMILYEEQEKQKKIRDGQEFENEAYLQVRTENPQDTITEIRINGKKQKIPKNSKVYRFSLNEEKPYEITAAAADRAGNTAAMEMGIQVVREKSLTERVAEPIKQMFLKREQSRKKEEGTEAQAWKNGHGDAGWIAVFAALWACGGGAIYCFKSLRQKDRQV